MEGLECQELSKDSSTILFSLSDVASAFTEGQLQQQQGLRSLTLSQASSLCISLQIPDKKEDVWFDTDMRDGMSRVDCCGLVR